MKRLRSVVLWLVMLMPGVVHAQYGCWGGVCEMPHEPMEPVYVPRPLSLKDLDPYKEDLFSAIAVASSGAVTTALSFGTAEEARQHARAMCEEKSPGQTCTVHEMQGRTCASVIRGKSDVFVYIEKYEELSLKGANKLCRKAKQKPCNAVLTACTAWLPPWFPPMPSMHWYENSPSHPSRYALDLGQRYGPM